MSSRTVGGRAPWSTRWGPVVVNPRAGLNWTAETAYAIQDANRGNARSLDTWLAINQAQDGCAALAGFGKVNDLDARGAHLFREFWRAAPGIGQGGLAIDHGTSHIQVVGFDARGPVAHALLTYGQSTDPASPHATDQTRLFARKQWPRLPFLADERRAARLGEPLQWVTR